MKIKNSSNAKNINNPYRINSEITAEEIKVIDQEGSLIGTMSVSDGIKKAQAVSLDLVEVSPNTNPPVCKIANFGKMKYELQKKQSDAKKKQKIVDIKEVKMTINIGKGDYDVKLKHTKDFIAKGCKVKISIRMKGREITHRELAEKMMSDIIESVSDFAKTEFNPKLEGMQYSVILVKC